jgi:4-hydroxy-3-polyprenylbenzoate decarboxylase
MPYRCLADFLEELGHAGELVRVEAEVDPVLEAAKITARVARQDGPALLFGALKGHATAVLTNLLGTELRMCRALGAASLGEVSARIASLLQAAESEGWWQRLKAAPHSSAFGNLAPRQVRSGPCQQVIRLGRDVDLGELPALQAAVGEAGRVITAAATFTAAADVSRQVAGRYDLQILGPDRLAACWAAPDEPARLLEHYHRRSEKMPLGVVLGGDPAVLLAAAALLPEVDACALAGLLRGKPLDVLPGRSVGLQVPADAEMVIEGYVDPSEPPLMAGPLCTPAGYYSLPRLVPVMHVTAVTHRANPVFPAWVYTAPPHEATVVARVLARVFLPLVKSAIPELVDYDLPAWGGARQVAILSVQKTYAGQACRVAAAAWGLRQLMFAKLLIVVDEEVDVHDPQQVAAAVAAQVDPGRDVFFQQGPPDPFDPATPPGRLGQKMAVDATRKTPEEHGGPPPQPAVASEATAQLVSQRWPEYGLGPEAEGSE